jgi:hypothetical protein
MQLRTNKERRFFEWMLIAISIATTALFARMGPFKMVALNLFYLPIVLAGYFLGRFSAGVLALLCVLVVTIVTMVAPSSFAGYDLPIVVALALTVWGAVLGLTAILVGTLCDARATTVRELHTAYVGVVEVLTQYLQGGNAHLKTRSERIAALSQMIGEELGLSQKQVDDVRVAALLHELGNVEVTTQVISRAFDKLEEVPAKHTFLGTDLVQSLGSVLEGALPLLAEQEHTDVEEFGASKHATAGTASRGARIIQAARLYDDSLTELAGDPGAAQGGALERLRAELAPDGDDEVLEALERVVQRRSRFVPEEPVLA